MDNIDNIDTGELVTASGKTLIPVLPQEERVMTSRFGYKLEVKDFSGAWLPTIKTFNDDGKMTPVRTDSFFTGNTDIDHITSALLTHYFKHYTANTINEQAKGIGLVTSEIIQGAAIQEAMINAISFMQNGNELTAIKRLGRWFLMYELDGYSFDFDQELQQLSRGSSQNSYMTIHLRDDEEGPFMREELLILREALKNPYIHLEDRVIMGLMLEWGLRPIQIVLLKQSDFEVRETGGVCLYHLNIPRVKQGAKQRRQQFTKRPISRELGEMIDQLIQIHQVVFADLNIKDPPLIMRRYKLFKNNHPYQLRFVSNYYKYGRNPNWDVDIAHKENPYQDVYDANDKSDMAHHVERDRIQYRLDNIIPHLPMSPRTGRPFNLFAYRFRYTVGTSLVQEGYSQAEVADALDHSNTSSVRHYFRETAEMNELIEEATNRRVEQGMFVAAWSRSGEIENNIYGEDIIELRSLTVVGKCAKGSPCWMEPAVACYGCSTFQANADVEAHKNALKTIEEKIENIHNTSTGAASHQLDEARAGCLAAIAYAEGKEVLFINGGGVSKTVTMIGKENE